MNRLAYISFDQVPAAKGASTHIEAFVRGLAAEFGRVDLVTVGATTYCERWPGVRHWELPGTGANLVDRVLSFGGALTRWLANRDYDVIQFRSNFEGLPILRNRKGARLVFEVNGLPSIELKYRYPGCEDDTELMAKLIAQERACVAAADCVVTPSAVTRDFLRSSRGAKGVEVIPNGVNVDLFRASEPPEGGLLYFGTLSAWQGVEVAIRAVAQVDDVLTVLGTGSRVRRVALERLASKLNASDRVVFRDPVTQYELANELARCQTVMAPLLWNDRNVLQGCCPLKVLEGMAAGRAVISSDLEVVSQLGVHGEHFLLTKAGSVDGVVAALARLRAEPELALYLGANARRRICDRFTWPLAVEKLARVYRSMLQQSG